MRAPFTPEPRRTWPFRRSAVLPEPLPNAHNGGDHVCVALTPTDFYLVLVASGKAAELGLTLPAIRAWYAAGLPTPPRRPRPKRPLSATKPDGSRSDAMSQRDPTLRRLLAAGRDRTSSHTMLVTQEPKMTNLSESHSAALPVCPTCGAPFRTDGPRNAAASDPEGDPWAEPAAPPRLPPVQSLDDLAGAIVLGVRRADRVAVVLLERADGAQIALGFEPVSDLIVEPAVNARVRAIRHHATAYVFEFDPGTPARLEVWAAGHTLAALD